MAYQITKEGEIIFNGWERGIASSPHKGIANIQAGNISTEQGEVMANFDRVKQSQTTPGISGTVTPVSTTVVSLTMTGVTTFYGGMPITVSSSTITGLADGPYFIKNVGNTITLSTTLWGSDVVFTASGSANFTFTRSYGKPISKATETYYDGSATQYRYYILDNQGLVWVYDTALATTYVKWFLPDTTLLTDPSSIEIMNGWLFVFHSNIIKCKTTVSLNTAWGTNTLADNFASGLIMHKNDPHYSLSSKQGRLYYTDGNFIGSIFPNTSLLTGAPNIQSYARYTAVTTTGTIATLISGSLPTTITPSVRVPATFFSTGTISTALQSGGTTKSSPVVYIDYNLSNDTFEVFAAITGGSALDIQTGSSGTQYFNTLYPTSVSGKQTITFTPQRLNLPTFETAQVMGELGNDIIVGTTSNTLYPWNQVSVLPGTVTLLPEANSVKMLTVNNILYVLAGVKGNIYMTSGAAVSLATSVPDYCAGVPGTSSAYFEPYFEWGDLMYLRGRVWFSIQDQRAAIDDFSAKAGNCGGIWSFTPSQNYSSATESGMALRMENRASYGTYSGASSVLIPAVTQTGIGPQYWNGWYSSVSAPSYGIDFTSTTSETPCVVETDIVPIGTMLNKQTFNQIEYKLSTPITANQSVAIFYRQNSTAAWTTCGTAQTEGSTELSGYFTAVFEKGQWLQLRIVLTPGGVGGSANFVRLTQVTVR